MTAAARAQGRGLVSGALLVAGRELSAYFDSAIAWVYAVAFVVLANSIFMNEFFLTGKVEMTGFFDLMPLLLAIFLPAVSMRLWAEEKKQRTIEVLLTLPLRTIQAVVGKFLAALGLFGLFLVGTLPIPAMLFALGDPDPGPIAAGYLGLVLLGSLYLAFGALFSALSGDQIVAFVVSAVVGIALVLLGNPQVVAVLDGLAPGLAVGTLLYESVSVVPRYDAFVRGALELSGALFFGLLTALCLWTTALALDKGRG